MITYVPAESALDTTLAADATITLLGTYFQTNADVKAIKIRETVFIPSPFVGILLESNLSLVQAWAFSLGVIVTAGITKNCKTLLDWLCVALVCGACHDLSPLVVPEITAPVPERDLFDSRHQLLVRD